MIISVDQLGQRHSFTSRPQRIISLVPSQTHLLHYFNLDDEVIGITKFCIKPSEWHLGKIRVGGTKNVDIEKIRSLNPDLIIANKEENVKDQIDSLKEIAPVWVSDVNTLEEAISMISLLGSLLGKEEKASLLVRDINRKFEKLKEFVDGKIKTKVLYFIWDSPQYVAASKTFIDDLLERSGLLNVAIGERYPEITGSEEPDLVLLSSEPFPFSESHLNKYKNQFPKATIKLIDGEIFSWYGPKLLEAPEYIKNLIHELTV